MKVKTTGVYLLGAAVAVLVVVLCLWRSAAVEAVYPVEKAQQVFAEKLWARVVGMFHGASLAVENRRLRREVASLALARLDAERLEVENARLRRALEYTARSPEVWLPAAVLAEGGGSLSARRTIRVDKGAAAGIRTGAVVMVPEGVVGRVIAVTSHTSEILLIIDPSIKVACEVEFAGGSVRGILCGGTEDLLVLRHLSSAVELPPRSQVLTSGLGGVFPRGLPVGTLLEIRGDPGVSRREGEVQPAVDFTTLKDVFIRCEK